MADTGGVFGRFVVNKKQVVDGEVRAPYNWLVRWSHVGEEVPQSAGP